MIPCRFILLYISELEMLGFLLPPTMCSDCFGFDCNYLGVTSLEWFVLFGPRYEERTSSSFLWGVTFFMKSSICYGVKYGLNPFPE